MGKRIYESVGDLNIIKVEIERQGCNLKKRNKQIFLAIEKGYSQYIIVKVLSISQPTVYEVVKRSKE